MVSPHNSINAADELPPLHLLPAFSLVELLIVVSIIGVVLASAEPSYRIAEQRSAQNAAVAAYAQSLYRAQILATIGRGDSGWGVTIATSSLTLFKGATYALRDSTYDEQYVFQSPMTIGGTAEVDFTKFAGTTTAATTTIAAFGTTGRIITVNPKGTISY